VIAGAYSIGAASNAVNGGTNNGCTAIGFLSGIPGRRHKAMPPISARWSSSPGNVNGQAVVSVRPFAAGFSAQVAGQGPTVTRDLTPGQQWWRSFSLSLRLGVTPSIGGRFSRVTTRRHRQLCCNSAGTRWRCVHDQDFSTWRRPTVGTTSTGSVAITGSASGYQRTGCCAYRGTSVTVGSARRGSAGPNPLALRHLGVHYHDVRRKTVDGAQYRQRGSHGAWTYATAGPGFSPATGRGIPGALATATLNAGDSVPPSIGLFRAPREARTGLQGGTLTVAGTGITSQVVQLRG